MGDWVAGADRVTAITAVSQAFRQGGGPRLVIVDAPAGSGRTWVLEQAYRLFAVDDAGVEGRYWPDELPRGRLVPHLFVPGERSSLDRLWFAAAGGLTEGHALHQLADQFDAHAVVLRKALAHRAAAASRVGYWAVQAAGLTIAGAGLSTAGVGPFASALALFSLATAVDSTVRSGGPVTEIGSVESAKRSNAGLTVNPREAAEIQASVEALSAGLALVGREIPIMLVLDDAENLDSQTVRLIQAVMAGGGDICVVIATDLAVTPGEWGDWLRTAAATSTRCQVAVLGPVPDRDLAALVAELLPGLPEESRPGLAELLQAAEGQPGVLVDYLNLPAVRDALMSGSTLPAGLAALDKQARDDLRHQDITQPVRDTLELLALLGNATCTSWLAPLGLSDERLTGAEETGRIRVHEDKLVRFTTHRAYEAALRAYHHDHSKDQEEAVLDSYRQSVEQAHTTDAWTGQPVQARVAALTTLTNANASKADPDWLAELLDLRRGNGHVPNLHDTLLQAILTRLHTPRVGEARLVRATADTLAYIGERARAVALYEAELERLADRHGPTSAARIPALEALGYLNAAIGHDLLPDPEASTYLYAAVGQFREIVALRTARLRDLQSTEHWARLMERTIKIRWSLTETLVDLREFHGPTGALCEGQSAIDELAALGRALQPSTLRRRASLVHWTGLAGEPARARDLCAALLPDLRRILGPDHPDTLKTRQSLAYWTEVSKRTSPGL